MNGYLIQLIENVLFIPKTYCDVTTNKEGWTLIARFSNNDAKNWMKNSGDYWYDRTSAVGQTTDPADNTDMISPAFWLVNGTEFKITRSDDPSHTALLYTTGGCLGGQTFRSKMRSYGDFRNGKVWANYTCLGRCDVQYGGQYKDTKGFGGAECDGSLQKWNKTGFWCDWGKGDGAVMTIGGGGGSGGCDRADHGIGITEADEASFVHNQHGDVRAEEDEYDYGNMADRVNPSKLPTYALNMWVR